MPTNKIRKSRSSRPDISSTHWALLNDLEMPPDYDRWQAFSGPTVEQWLQHRDEILETWIEAKPGSRPSFWWRFDAPRWSPEIPGCEDWPASLDLCAPRQSLGGRGTASHVALAYTPELEKGLPTSWVTDFDIDYYNGRALGVDGKLVVTDYREGDFIAERFDPNDRPQFESQAAYLRRHKLLAVGEAKRLRKADFGPETVALPNFLETDDVE